ncbi:transcription elongation factor GreA [Acidaminobacterium chupaoyuni]
MAKQFTLTEERLKEIKEELEYLKTVREKEVADQIKEARSFGDLSENSEYDEAKNEQGKLYSRIAELENVLANAVIINEEAITTQHVSMGTKVKIVELEDDDEEEYFIVGAQEANPSQQRISDESPLGKALYGRGVGDVVTVEAPVGNIQYKILEITR